MQFAGTGLTSPKMRGNVLANAVPANLEGSSRLVPTRGGIVSLGNVNSTMIFGRVVSVMAGGDDAAFYLGWIPGGWPIGVILNEDGVRMNDPAKPTWLMDEMPVTIATGGRLRYDSWATSLPGSILPALGCRLIFSLATGEIEAMPAGSIVPSNWCQLNGAVVRADPFGPSVDLELGQPLYLGTFVFIVEGAGVHENIALAVA